MANGQGFTPEQIAAANREVARRRAQGQDTNVQEILAGIGGGGGRSSAITSTDVAPEAEALERQLLKQLFMAIGLERSQAPGVTDDSLLRLQAAGIEHNPFTFASTLIPQSQQAALSALGGPGGVVGGRFPAPNMLAVEAAKNPDQLPMSTDRVQMLKQLLGR